MSNALEQKRARPVPNRRLEASLGRRQPPTPPPVAMATASDLDVAAQRLAAHIWAKERPDCKRKLSKGAHIRCARTTTQYAQPVEASAYYFSLSASSARREGRRVSANKGHDSSTGRRGPWRSCRRRNAPAASSRCPPADNVYHFARSYLAVTLDNGDDVSRQVHWTRRREHLRSERPSLAKGFLMKKERKSEQRLCVLTGNGIYVFDVAVVASGALVFPKSHQFRILDVSLFRSRSFFLFFRLFHVSRRQKRSELNVKVPR